MSRHRIGDDASRTAGAAVIWYARRPDVPRSVTPSEVRSIPARLTITAFQALIRERYFATDSARGAPSTFLWFAEEVGELAEAIARRERGDGDEANLREEFADVLAWLTTLANITGVDLADAVQRKYLEDGGPPGTK